MLWIRGGATRVMEGRVGAGISECPFYQPLILSDPFQYSEQLTERSPQKPAATPGGARRLFIELESIES